MWKDILRKLIAPFSSFVYGAGAIFILFSMITEKTGSVKTMLTVIGIILFLMGIALSVTNRVLKKKQI